MHLALVLKCSYPEEIRRDDNNPQDPHASERELGEPPRKDDLADARVAEDEEAAERDEREGEVVDDGDGPPQDGRDDAHRLAEGPTPAKGGQTKFSSLEPLEMFALHRGSVYEIELLNNQKQLEELESPCRLGAWSSWGRG